MKQLVTMLVAALVLLSCGNKPADKNAQLAKLRKERRDIDDKIKAIEGSSGDTVSKAAAVSVMEVLPTDFIATVNVEAQVAGDQNVYASPQAPGIVKAVNVQVGQHVGKGQVLATLDDAAIGEQIQAQQAQLTFAHTIYQKQQQLWAQNIGTQVQLLQAQANYESAQKQQAALVAQRNMYRITSPIAGVVDLVNVKVGDASAPGMQNIRVVNSGKLKAEANLGENYLGKIRQGNPVTLLFPDTNDSIKTTLTYVSQAVDPISRAFLVQVRLAGGGKLHPNMSCIMKIANYENSHAFTVPISVIQKTGQGEMLYVVEGSHAKAVQVETGQSAGGVIEVLSGLHTGDKVITSGFEDLDNGDKIAIIQ